MPYLSSAAFSSSYIAVMATHFFGFVMKMTLAAVNLTISATVVFFK